MRSIKHTSFCLNTLFWDVDCANTCTLRIMMELLQISIFRVGNSTRWSLAALTLQYTFVLFFPSLAIAGPLYQLPRGRITVNFCLNPTNLRWFVPTVYYVTRAAEAGTCLGLLSGVCVCGGTCWISGECVINVPVRDLNQLLAMYPLLLIYPALIKTWHFNRKRQCLCSIPGPISQVRCCGLARPQFYSTLCAIQLQLGRKTFSCISY